jgi:hypothetical protein
MNAARIDRLLGGLPATVGERQRGQINGYGTTARRCEERVTALRVELDRALRDVYEAGAGGGSIEAADEAIRVALELDALERLQPRIDGWLRVAVGALSDDPGPAPFGEGPA